MPKSIWGKIEKILLQFSSWKKDNKIKSKQAYMHLFINAFVNFMLIGNTQNSALIVSVQKNFIK